jgi:hypothetical protein
MGKEGACLICVICVYLVYCGVKHILCCVWFSWLHLVYSVLTVSLDCSFLNVLSIFSNVYFFTLLYISCHLLGICYLLWVGKVRFHSKRITTAHVCVYKLFYHRQSNFVILRFIQKNTWHSFVSFIIVNYIICRRRAHVLFTLLLFVCV